MTSTKKVFFLSLSLDVDIIQTATGTADSYTSDRQKEAALKDSRGISRLEEYHMYGGLVKVE